MSAESSDLVSQGRSAVGRRRWREGYEILAEADAHESLDGPALDALADAAFALGHHDEYLDVRERAHASHVERGAVELAAADARQARRAVRSSG